MIKMQAHGSFNKNQTKEELIKFIQQDSHRMRK